MKNYLYKVFIIAFAFAGLICLPSCEKDNSAGDGSYLEGTYILQRVEITYEDGEKEVYDSKDDFSDDNDEVLFDYEYIFEENGSYSFKGTPEDRLVSGCSYTIKNNVLSMTLSSLWDAQFTAYTIVSNKGGTLVLEPTKDMLDFYNDFASLFGESIKKTTGTYKKQ